MIPLVLTIYHYEGVLGDDSPSLDRIVSSLGYVKGNIRVISYKANRVKSNATLEELRKVYEDSLRVSQVENTHG